MDWNLLAYGFPLTESPVTLRALDAICECSMSVDCFFQRANAHDAVVRPGSFFNVSGSVSVYGKARLAVNGSALHPNTTEALNMK